MRRKFLCGLAAALSGPVLSAQPLPARDLWQFPLGAVIEPAAFASEAGSGHWNPATVAMPKDTRLRLGVAWLRASQTQGVDGQLVGLGFRRKDGLTVGLSVARTAISGLVRTDTDPTSTGSIQYNTTMVSATAARHVIPHLTIGASARYREGRTDLLVRSAIAADLGVVVDSLSQFKVRVAVSSFLWRPGRETDDRPMFLSAIDARLLPNLKVADVRVGYMENAVSGGIREHGPFVSASISAVEARGGLVVTKSYGDRDLRARVGLLLRLNRYTVGIGAEQGVGGLAPLAQFTLSSLVK